MSVPKAIWMVAYEWRKQCTIKVKATKREYEKNKLQVVENELYFIILPNSNNARQSRI